MNQIPPKANQLDEDLEQELARMIMELCKVEAGGSQTPFPRETFIIGPLSPFGLDSLDAVEIVVAVQRSYGVRIPTDERGREVMETLGSLADFIRGERMGGS